MDREGALTLERIDEITKMCEREQPIYEQISNFSIALYVFGYFLGSDLLSIDDVDHVEAGTILKDCFEEIQPEAIARDYHIAQSPERYLLVIGDPLFPAHFAVVADMQSAKPFFSKLPFFGSGFDSLAELEGEFLGIDGLTKEDVHCYRQKQPALKRQQTAKIYVLKYDETSHVVGYK